MYEKYSGMGKTTQQKDTTFRDGILADQDADRDDAHKDARLGDNTSETTQRNDDTENKLRSQWKLRNHANQEHAQQKPLDATT